MGATDKHRGYTSYNYIGHPRKNYAKALLAYCPSMIIPGSIVQQLCKYT